MFLETGTQKWNSGAKNLLINTKLKHAKQRMLLTKELSKYYDVKGMQKENVLSIGK